jgi:hypothetical protein
VPAPTPDSSDLVAATGAQIERRLDELRPLVAEVARLERALAALQGIEGKEPERAAATASRASPAGAPTRASELGHARGPVSRARANNRGVTVAEAAKSTGVSPTYLYRIAATL